MTARSKLDEADVQVIAEIAEKLGYEEQASAWRLPLSSKKEEVIYVATRMLQKINL